MNLERRQRVTMSESTQPDVGGAGSDSSSSKPSRAEPSSAEKTPKVSASSLKSDRSKDGSSERRLTYEQHVSYRSGTLPEPAELAAYNAIIPDGAERLLKMVEAQSSHRIEMEKLVITSQQAREFRGQLYAFLIAVIFAFIGLYAAINGHTAFACIIVGATLAGIVGAFIYSKNAAQKDLVNKAKDMKRPSLLPNPQTADRQK